MTGKVKVVREEQTIYALTQLFQDLIDGQKVKMTIFEGQRERENLKRHDSFKLCNNIFIAINKIF